jgi:hypothetical protein
MRKSQNRSIRNKRRQRNITLQKVNNHTVEDLLFSEMDESPLVEVRRKISMLNEHYEEFKEDIKKQLNESQENTELKKKTLKDTQKYKMNSKIIPTSTRTKPRKLLKRR